MKVVILNGNPKPENAKFDQYLQNLSSLLKKSGHTTTIFNLRDMKLNYCIGCYSCWVKTPGVCTFKDDGPKILKEYINSDLVLFTSPIIMGFISALLKGLNERLLPLAHAHLAFENGKFTHVARYDKYPMFGLLLEKRENDNSTNIDIIKRIYATRRTSKFVFTKLTNDSTVEEVAYEINNI